jgi:hypothetical protein
MPATEIRQLGMVGLGRMGANLVRRLMRDGHHCVVYNRTRGPIEQLAKEGATPTWSVDEFVSSLTKPRSAWVMVPAGDVTGQVIEELASRMEPGDIIIDGGNSYYRDDIQRSKKLAERGIRLVHEAEHPLGSSARALRRFEVEPRLCAAEQITQGVDRPSHKVSKRIGSFLQEKITGIKIRRQSQHSDIQVASQK